MKLKGFTQESLAARLQISHSAVSRWLSGSMPRPARLLQLAEILGVDVRILESESLVPDHTVHADEVERQLAESPQAIAERLNEKQLAESINDWTSMFLDSKVGLVRDNIAANLKIMCDALVRKIYRNNQ